MTSFIAWTGLDSRGPSSIYFASDSRLTGPLKYDAATGKTLEAWRWDFGRKLFASQRYPDIWGYVGDVLFPSQILGQITELVDTGILFQENDTPEAKLEKLMRYFTDASKHYPFMPTVQILYASRLDLNSRSSLKSTFRLFHITWERDKWNVERIGMPLREEKSGKLIVLGSGSQYINSSISQWQNSPHKDTSRSFFAAFCDGLETTKDANTGGSPQLVGIHRKGCGKYFGVVYQGQTCFLGLPITRPLNPGQIEWFDDLFQVTSGKTKKRLEGAQAHSDIK